MDDLITRQVAIEAVEQIRFRIWEVDIPSPTVPEYIEHHKQMKELIEYCDKLREKIEAIPSIEPQRKKGYLKKDPKYGCVCSECGNVIDEYHLIRFCTWCGADLIPVEVNGGK